MLILGQCMMPNCVCALSGFDIADPTLAFILLCHLAMNASK